MTIAAPSSVSYTTIAAPSRVSSAGYVIHLMEVPVISDLLDRLITILERHRTSADRWAAPLHRWGTEVCELMLTESDDSSDFLDRLALKIHELRIIAINPIDHAPLLQPVVANKRIWEEWMLQHIRTVFDGMSPYNEEKLEEEQIHEFTSELLELVNVVFEPSVEPCVSNLAAKLLYLRSKESRGGWLNRAAVEVLPPSFAISGYSTLISLELELHSEEKMTKAIIRGADSLNAVVAASEARIKEHVAATLARQAESDARLASDLYRIRSTYDAISSRLEVSEARVLSQEERIRSLEARICAAEAQNLINQEAANSDSGCVIM